MGASTQLQNLKFSPDEIAKMATALQNERNTLNVAFDRIEQLDGQICGEWAGRAADIYCERAKAQRKDFEERLLILNEYILDLNTVSGIYEKAEATAKAMANDLSTSGVFRN